MLVCMKSEGGNFVCGMLGQSVIGYYLVHMYLFLDIEEITMLEPFRRLSRLGAIMVGASQLMIMLWETPRRRITSGRGTPPRRAHDSHIPLLSDSDAEATEATTYIAALGRLIVDLKEQRPASVRATTPYESLQAYRVFFVTLGF